MSDKMISNDVSYSLTMTEREWKTFFSHLYLAFYPVGFNAERSEEFCKSQALQTLEWLARINSEFSDLYKKLYPDGIRGKRAESD